MKASIIIVLALMILQAVMSNILDWEQLLLKLFLVVMLIPSTLEKKNLPCILRNTQIGISLTQFLGMSCSKTPLTPPVRVRWVKLCLTSGTVN